MTLLCKLIVFTAYLKNISLLINQRQDVTQNISLLQIDNVLPVIQDRRAFSS